MDNEATEPVKLVEDASTGDRFLVYSTEKGLRLDVRFEGETLWMSQAQIATLFGRDVSTISRHIANVFEDGELDEATSLQKAQTTTGRPRGVCAETLLDRQLQQLGRAVLRTGGSVKASDARLFAEGQYALYDEQRKLDRQRGADNNIAALALEARKLPKSPRW